MINQINIHFAFLFVLQMTVQFINLSDIRNLKIIGFRFVKQFNLTHWFLKDTLKYTHNCIFDHSLVYSRNGSLIVDFWLSVARPADVVTWRNVIKDVLEKNGSIHSLTADPSYFVYDSGNRVMFTANIYFCYKGCKTQFYM